MRSVYRLMVLGTPRNSRLGNPMQRWSWIGIGIACLAFLEFVVLAGSDVGDLTRWIIYGFIGLGVLGKAFPQSEIKNKAERRVRAGYSHQDAGNFNAAESCFRDALSILAELEDPKQRRIGEALQHSNLGLLYHQSQRTEEAAEFLERAIATYLDLGRNDDCAPLYASLAKVQLDVQDLYAAEQSARRAVELYGRRAFAHQQLEMLTQL